MSFSATAGAFSSNGHKDRSLHVVVCVVLVTHALLLLWTAYFSDFKPAPPKPQERLVVKTIALNPTKRTETVAIAPPQPVQALPEPVQEAAIQEPEPVIEPPVEERAAAPEPEIELIPVPEPLPEKPKLAKPTPQPKKEVKKPEPKKAPKKETPKKETPKKQASKPTPKKEVKVNKPQPVQVAKKVEKPKEDKQAAAVAKKFQEAQQLIAKVGQGKGKVPTSKNSASLLSAPGKISLQVEALPTPGGAPISSYEMGYRDLIASLMQVRLKLPDHGAVKVELTLERSGKVAKLVVVDSKSVLNRDYIVKELPTLPFPSFGENMVGKDQHTFTIALKNE